MRGELRQQAAIALNIIGYPRRTIVDINLMYVKEAAQKAFHSRVKEFLKQAFH